MTEAEKAYQYFVIAVPENEEQAKAYFWARKALQSTIPPAERVGKTDACSAVGRENADGDRIMSMDKNQLLQRL